MRTLSLFLLAACAGDGDPSDDTGPVDGDDSALTTDDCGGGGGEAPVGPCLTAAFAGSYTVTAVEGSHTRGVVTISGDGDVDYDDGLDFLVADQEGVYDRLDCCNRVSVEMLQRPDNDTSLATDARHRVDLFTDGPSTSATVTSFEYYPNWPDAGGKVVLEVQ